MVTNCGSVQCVCVAILCALACDSRRRGVPVPSPQQDAQPAKHLEASDNLAADAQSKFAPDAAPDATGAGKPVGKIDLTNVDRIDTIGAWIVHRLARESGAAITGASEAAA